MTPPLTPEQRAAYGDAWADTSAAIRERAGQRCECEGECGWPKHLDDIPNRREPRCYAKNGKPSPLTGSTVVLTTAHLDRNGHTGVHEPDRLKAMCQGCHLAYDRKPARVPLPRLGVPPEDWPTAPGDPT